MSRSLLLVLLLAGGGACLALGACGQAVKQHAAPVYNNITGERLGWTCVPVMERTAAIISTNAALACPTPPTTEAGR